MAATVIGAGGFVGQRLVQALTARDEAPWTPAKGDPQVLTRDMGVVYYCAGLTADYDRRPFDTVEAHASLVSRIIEVGRFERIVYCSSTRLYDGRAVAAATEDLPLVFDPADPRRTYDLSKALGENLVLTRSGGRGAVARLANVFDWAAGSPGFLSEWLIRARTGRDLTLDSSPHVARDYIHLDDAVAGLIAMAGAPDPGIVNLASGELVANGQIAQVFADAGRQVRFTRDGAPPSPPNASAAKLIGLGVTPTPVREVVRRYLASKELT
jgi:nucleoside-diphosphate-sugar epimerase